MAPHLTEDELDFAQAKASAGKTPVEVHALLAKKRARKGVDAPNLTNVRKALKGKTYKRGRQERRGRKLKLSPKVVKSMNKIRKELTKKADGDYEVRWKDVLKKSKAPQAHRSTAKRAFERAGVSVQWRRPREKPQRPPEIKKERVKLGSKLAKRPGAYYADEVDLIIDNKRFDTPTHEQARKYLKKGGVRGHLRLASEGLNDEFTKPSKKKNRMNTGGSVSVCAGISNCRIVLWEYLKGRWNGDSAVALYQGPIMKALKKERGQKRSYTVLEDNDPSGYKSSKAVAAKRALRIKPLLWPRYSPDLHPLDYSIWEKIHKRVLAKKVTGKETVKAFKKRLRLTALRTPSSEIRDSIVTLPKRAKAVVDAKGGNIPRD